MFGSTFSDMKNLFLVLGLSLTYVSVEGQMYDRLYSNLMKNYNPDTIPIRSSNVSVLLNLGLSLVDVKSIDTDTGDANIDVWVHYTWTDGRLTWSRKKYDNIDTIRLKPDRIWRPDIEIYDGEMKSKDNLAILSNNGEVNFIPKTVVSVRCDLSNYTQDDTVTCSAKLGSWTYDGMKIDLQLFGEDIDVTNFKSDRWDLESSSLMRNVIHYPCCPEPYPDVTATMVFRDKKKRGWSFF